MKYGSAEYAVAAPIAESLIVDADFRKWVLSKSCFKQFLDARLLHNEMAIHRGSTAEWWRFHFTEKCRCAGCRGKETDILAIFEAASNFRFAIHFEVKQPGDRFKADGVQSRGYRLRAGCWSKKPPAKVLRHDDATTALIFSQKKMEEYAPHLAHFDFLITLEEIERSFSRVARWRT